MSRLAALAALLAGCVAAEPIPEPLNATEVEAGPAGTAAAIDLILARRGADVGIDLLALEAPAIRWFAGADVLCYSAACERVANGLDHTPGRYFGRGPEIHLATRSRPRWTALDHELIHWALDLRDGDADGEHLDPLWDTEREMQLALGEAGL